MPSDPGLPVIASHMLKKRTHGSAWEAPTGVIEKPVRHYRAPFRQELHQPTAVQMRGCIIVYDMRDPSACQRRLQLIVRGTHRQAPGRRDLHLLIATREAPADVSAAREPALDTVMTDEIMRPPRLPMLSNIVR